MMRLAPVLTAFAATLLASAQLVAADVNPVRTHFRFVDEPTPERFIVKMKGASSPMLQIQAASSGESVSAAGPVVAAMAQRAQSLTSRNRLGLDWSRPLGPDLHVLKVMALAGEGVVEMLARLRADPEVEYAEVDRRVSAYAIPNDPLAAGQWYLQSLPTTPSAINAYTAWDTTKGSDNVVIAVIDTGVRFDHPDLKRTSANGRLLPGYDFVSPDSANNFKTANDGDGRDTDPSDPGDWVTSADNCGAASNSSWHGTRVSGIIGALSNNGIGVAGITWSGRILPVRVIGKCGGFNSDVIAGARWAAGLSVPGVPANPTPAKILNISLGAEGSCDSASADAVSQINALGVLIVAAAGNEGGPVDSPANCPGAMGIAGLRHAGTKVGYSSLGPQIALAAPAGNCPPQSDPALPGCQYSIDTTTNDGDTVPGNNIYTHKTATDNNIGTSFSAPIVSGVAGLMLAVNSHLKSPQLLARLQEGATKPFPTTSETSGLPTCHVPASSSDVQDSECVCTTNVCGAGMANANGSVQAALRPIADLTVQGTVSPGASLTLQGAGSTAADGHTVSSYSWIRAGQVISTGLTANIVAPSSGALTACLTVTDDVGKQDSAKVVITPSNAAISTQAPGANACLADVSVIATDAAAVETGDTGTFTFTRVGDTSAALDVTISLSGSALNGTDYQTMGTTVNFAAGATTAMVTLTPIDNSVIGGSKTATATIVDGAFYSAGSPRSASITISEDDVATAPPPASGGGGSGSGGGGGGSLDEMTLLGLAFVSMTMLIHRRRSFHLNARLFGQDGVAKEPTRRGGR